MRRSAAALLGTLALVGCGTGGDERPVASRTAASLPGRDLDPARTRTLPTQGLVVSRGQGLVLAGLDGRVVGRLQGYEVDALREQGRFDRVVYVRDRSGHEWSIGASGLRRVPRPSVVPFPPGYNGCDSVAGRYLVCGRPGPRRQTSRVVRRETGGRLRRLLGPAVRTTHGVIGRWVGVYPSPGGRTLLLQWSGECEIPQAYLATASGTRLRPVASPATTMSRALGWTTDGRALVSVAVGDCGRGQAVVTYAVDPRSGTRTPVSRGEAAFWGDASLGTRG